MTRRKLQVFNQYRYGPRSVLIPGDRFRVAGGPVYVTDGGEKISMAEIVFPKLLHTTAPTTTRSPNIPPTFLTTHTRRPQ